jgi:hypothetical protein
MSDEAKMIITLISSLAAVVIVALVFDHIETRHAMDKGYNQVIMPGRRAPVWQHRSQ